MNKHFIEECQIKEIIRYSPKGVTMPLICRVSDDREAYVKYRKNPFGPRVLLNEWIGNTIADALGICIPYYGIGILKEDVVAACYLEDFVMSSNYEKCFVSVRNSNLVPISQGLITRSTELNLSKILLFHCIVNDLDSHEGNVLYDIASDKVVLLDFSHIMDVNTHKSAEDLKKEYADCLNADQVFDRNEDTYRLLGLSTHRKMADTLLMETEEAIHLFSMPVIHEIVYSTPEEWQKLVGSDILSAYKQILDSRIHNLHGIAQTLIVKGGL